jgi:hypothetical protein
VHPAGEGARLVAELQAFLELGASLMVGTRDADCVPELMRAWGPRVGRDRRSVTLCVARAGSARTLANLRDNGRLAVTCARPLDSNAIQLWGRCLGRGPATRQDLAAVRAHRDVFARVNEGIGIPRPFIEALWQRELAGSPAMVRIRFAADQIFNQTPGPGAGSPL